MTKENFYPRISIVTPSYNQGKYIEQTIQSVLSQNYPNLEYIVIDGGSTDESVEIIRKYAPQLTCWISEKDEGQANAINKGLKLCTGEIFNWLNSDDYLQSGALLKIAAAFSDTETKMVAGIVRNFSTEQEEFVANQNLSAEGLMRWKPGVQFVQPGVWMRRTLLDECGGIDEKFHYSFDWDLYIRYLYLFPVVKQIPDLLVHFRLHDQSKTQSFTQSFIAEEREVIKKIRTLNRFNGLHAACQYKIDKTEWTEFLSGLSTSKRNFFYKLIATLKQMPQYKKVSFTRQTAGAIKAFWNNRVI